MSADREAAIRLERERRHWTIPQWREAEGKDWPAANAQIRIDADAAVDSLLSEFAAAHEREKAVTDLAERWEREAEEADKRARSENASSLEDQVEDRRSASRARNRAAELRAALADGEGEDKKINYRDLIEKIDRRKI